MRWFNEAKSVVPKVGAGKTAMILKHCLTLRSKGRCAIKPRSAPELGR
jgi:Ni2+-binding GTPase involved in maturation of urease and hydrogenase